VVDANLLAATRDGVSGRVYNVACGARTTLVELARLIERAAGGSVARSFIEARSGDIKESVADIARARAELGYAPAVGVEDGLARLVAYARASA
jgi:UDP-glucose 4-epimerase